MPLSAGAGALLPDQHLRHKHASQAGVPVVVRSSQPSASRHRGVGRPSVQVGFGGNGNGSVLHIVNNHLEEERQHARAPGHQGTHGGSVAQRQHSISNSANGGRQPASPSASAPLTFFYFDPLDPEHVVEIQAAKPVLRVPPSSSNGAMSLSNGNGHKPALATGASSSGGSAGAVAPPVPPPPSAELAQVQRLHVQLDEVKAKAASLRQYEMLYKEAIVRSKQLQSEVEAIRGVVAEKNMQLSRQAEALRASNAERHALRTERDELARQVRQLRDEQMQTQQQQQQQLASAASLGDSGAGAASSGSFLGPAMADIRALRQELEGARQTLVDLMTVTPPVPKLPKPSAFETPSLVSASASVALGASVAAASLGTTSGGASVDADSRSSIDLALLDSLASDDSWSTLPGATADADVDQPGFSSPPTYSAVTSLMGDDALHGGSAGDASGEYHGADFLYGADADAEVDDDGSLALLQPGDQTDDAASSYGSYDEVPTHNVMAAFGLTSPLGGVAGEGSALAASAPPEGAAGPAYQLWPGETPEDLATYQQMLLHELLGTAGDALTTVEAEITPAVAAMPAAPAPVSAAAVPGAAMSRVTYLEGLTPAQRAMRYFSTGLESRDSADDDLALALLGAPEGDSSSAPHAAVPSVVATPAAASSSPLLPEVPTVLATAAAGTGAPADGASAPKPSGLQAILAKLGGGEVVSPWWSKHADAF